MQWVLHAHSAPTPRFRDLQVIRRVKIQTKKQTNKDKTHRSYHP
jgi:hypothetical protein